MGKYDKWADRAHALSALVIRSKPSEWMELTRRLRRLRLAAEHEKLASRWGVRGYWLPRIRARIRRLRALDQYVGETAWKKYM